MNEIESIEHPTTCYKYSKLHAISLNFTQVTYLTSPPPSTTSPLPLPIPAPVALPSVVPVPLPAQVSPSPTTTPSLTAPKRTKSPNLPSLHTAILNLPSHSIPIFRNTLILPSFQLYASALTLTSHGNTSNDHRRNAPAAIVAMPLPQWSWESQ